MIEGSAIAFLPNYRGRRGREEREEAIALPFFCTCVAFHPSLVRGS
ncbi:hypothetical protein NDA03_11900 [Trichocoleus sp. Lan]